VTLVRKQAGQSLVESALILGAFMGLLLGMAGLGQSLFVRQTLADRTRIAARWGALNRYDPAAIRRVVLFGTAEPAQGETPFFGLTPAVIDVSNPGCPGAQCRISVAIPEHGIRAIEPIQAEPTKEAIPSALAVVGPVSSQP
jgi:hypothetical protein